ncbi:cobalt ECF transporter T component CbiQ [Methanosalsum natronophilum]|uniref:Cobalt ECF transporter T component CbiQ n=1 Tax=Methanosalsum natronophilum TaxID=768733 RepID=A0A424Z4H1_9EURY|nr:cobalt ECF transporter T component CbiQ [Methanosalsum natronophilum]MCS3923973.1 cobalt/nickel transport system permease protein [Methanosalsum natronophilum]RQD92180.1 MAG: cobalt ECF transporter T component CbiQ [Methanosalsum natronophilum]
MSYPKIDKYSYLETPLHQFDPRAKIISLIVLIFSFAFISEIIIAITAVIFSILLVIISRIPLSFVTKCLKFPAFFVFTIIIVMAFTVEGNIIVDLKYLNVTNQGVELGALIFLRALAALMIAFLLLSTSKFDEIIKAMYMLKIPNVMVQVISFSYRYIFVLIDELSTLRTAMYARGFKFKLDMYSFSAIGNMIGMLLIKSYDRGERVYRSMIARGYTGNPNLFVTFSMNRNDYLISTILLIFALIVQIIPVIS